MIFHGRFFRSTFLYLTFIFLVAFLCLNSSFVSKSFANGLSLWYNQLVPLLLPFLLLSGFFLSLIDWEHPNKAGCLILLFLCGLFCGYPVGAIAINRLYRNQIISRNFAHAVMPLCNNISPMFLTGYVYHQYLDQQICFPLLLIIIYLPQLFYALLFYHLSSLIKDRQHITHGSYLPESAAALNQTAQPSILENSITTITVIGIYVAIFSVLYDIVLKLSGNIFPIHIMACSLEITKGLSELASLSILPIQKTALILSVTSFGGVSSLFQSMHILKETKLSFICYTSGKCICAICSYLMVLLLL